MKLFKNFKTKKQLRKEIEDLKKQLLEEEEKNSILLGKTIKKSKIFKQF